MKKLTKTELVELLPYLSENVMFSIYSDSMDQRTINKQTKETTTLKYELTTESIKHYERTLYRIKALKDFGNVKTGDLGGFVESEANLSQEGNCWVYGDAKVFENAKVYGNAKVYENAQVFGYALVYGYAMVCGNAVVSGNARVFGDVWVYGDAKIFGNAVVYGNAKIFGNAQVYGEARVSGKIIFNQQENIHFGEYK